MTNLRLARPSRIVRESVEWYRHARIGFIIHVRMGRQRPGRPGNSKALRRWYMLGREFV